jgi:3-deoxy-7-phosphoheptulonate synthase
MNSSKWIKYSWRSFPAKQQPHWPDTGELKATLKNLIQLPPLVFTAERLALKQELADAVNGKAFILQCGDCSEDFSRCTGPATNIKGRL